MGGEQLSSAQFQLMHYLVPSFVVSVRHSATRVQPEIGTTPVESSKQCIKQLQGN